MFVNYYAFFVEYVADEVLTYEEVALLLLYLIFFLTRR